MKKLIVLVIALVALSLFSGAVAQEKLDSYLDYGKAVAKLSDAGTKGELEDVAASRLLLKSKKAMTNLDDFGPIAVVAGPDNHYTMQFATADKAVECMKALGSDPNVIYAHQDHVVSVDAKKTLTGAKADPYKSWGAVLMGADEYAESIKASGSVTVAIIDSGVSRHSFIKNRIKSGGFDLVDTNNKDGTSDEHGHGTHVAGTVVDLTQGLKVNILPVRVLDGEGGGTGSAVANGIRCAADAGAKVMNLSLGGNYDQPYAGLMSDERDAVDYAVSKGATIVVAAGNESDDVCYGTLACFDNVIVVGAIDNAFEVADFSNFGDTLDVVGPGVNVVSCDVNGGFVSFSGTSMATPHITAIAAMVKLENPGFSPARVESYIKDNCKDLGASGWDRTYGYGMPTFAELGNIQGDFYTFRINEDGAVITDYAGADTALTLPETLGGKTVVGVADEAFAGNTMIESLVVPGCYKEIGNYAFSECVNLKSVTFNEGVIKIGDGVFNKCENLASVALPESLTDIGGNAFSYCASLTGIKFPSKLEAIGAFAFSNSGITSMTIPASTANMNPGLLAHCENLETVTIEEGIKGISPEALQGCVSIKSIVVPEGVKSLGDYSLADCPALTSVTLPRSLVYVEMEAFENSPNITIHSYTGSNVEGVAQQLDLPFVSLGIQTVMTKIIPKQEGALQLDPGGMEDVDGLYECEPDNATIKELDWVSSDTNVADIKSTFDPFFGFTITQIIAKDEGTCVFTGTAKDGSGLTITQKVEVAAPLPRVINLSTYSLKLNEGDAEQITATVVPAAVDQSVDWSSDNAEVASVDDKGIVTAHKTGSATITATCRLDNTLKADCDVTVVSAKSEAGDFKVNIIDNTTAEITGYTGSATDVTIPAVIDGKQIVRISDKAFFQSGITSVSISEGVHTIGAKAFAGCKKLGSVSLPQSLVSLATDAFANCNKLPKVKKLETKLTDDNGAFFVTPLFTPSNTASAYSITAAPKKNADINSYGHVSPLTDDYFALTIKASGKKAVIGVKDTEPYAAGSVKIKGKAKRNVKTGKDINLSYVVKPDTARVVATWESSDPEIAFVSPEGVVSTLAPGKVKITLQTDLGLSDSITLIVKGKPVPVEEEEEY